METLIEQRIIKRLAELGYITSVGDVVTALEDASYAKELISGNDIPGIEDDLIEEGIGGGSGSTECDHEALTNEEIQEVFDNDEEESSK